LLDELIDLDYRTIEGLTQNHEGQTSQWSPVFMDHPDTWRLLITGPGRIVGYWHFVPLFQPEYEIAKQGQLTDSKITADTVRVLELPGWYDIYFVSICVHPPYRRTPRMRALFKAFFDVVTELAREGVFIREVCANAYTGSGDALCKDLGFKFVTNHVDHGKIYSMDFIGLLSLDISKGHQELRQLYGLTTSERRLRLV
jgi:GNAT superfamily N-acetyltransferase